MTIAVDFDGTIVEHAYPRIGKPLPFALEVLRKLHLEENHRLILWTMREGKMLQDAVDFCAEKGVHFFACNKNYPEEEMQEGVPRKIAADIYIDDRNIGGLPDWGTIYKMIKSNFQDLEDLAYGETQFSQARRKWFNR
jgi:hypothetical protein